MFLSDNVYDLDDITYSLLGYKLEKEVLEKLAESQGKFHDTVEPLLYDLEKGRLAPVEYYNTLEENTKSMLNSALGILGKDQFTKIFQYVNLDKPLTGILELSMIQDYRTIH